MASLHRPGSYLNCNFLFITPYFLQYIYRIDVVLLLLLTDSMVRIDDLLSVAATKGWTREALPLERNASEWNDVRKDCGFSKPDISMLKNTVCSSGRFK